MKNYSVLMGNAMNLCKGMPNRSDSARDLLHDTVTKTLDYFSKGKDLPLEEMHFWMIRVMENTFKDIKNQQEAAWKCSRQQVLVKITMTAIIQT